MDFTAVRLILTDEKGVSPVIAVILMVAITVILGTVIGTFTMGIGGEIKQNPPQATFTFDFNDSSDDAANIDDEIVITHDGGDMIESGQITVQFTDFKLVGGPSPSGTYTPLTSWTSTSISAGTSLTVDNEIDLEDSDGDLPPAGELDLNEATIRIVWSKESGSSHTIAEWKGPDA